MLTCFRKRHIPWLMAATRAGLGPVIIAGAASDWNGLTLATIVIAALLSDIFDGILARRWHCDTAAVRLFDTLADTAFYLSTAAALWIAHPQLLHAHSKLLGALFSLEAARLAFDFAKFGKPASYHSYMAKTWGLVLALAVILAFANSSTNALFTVAIILGILCDLEGLTMSLLLPRWQKDVKTLQAAWALRRVPQITSRRSNGLHSASHDTPASSYQESADQASCHRALRSLPARRSSALLGQTR